MIPPFDKLNNRQLSIIRNALIAKSNNDIQKVVDIITSASDEDVKAISEVLKEVHYDYT